MYQTSEVLEDIQAQRFDEDGNVLESVIIPRGTKLTILDMGDCAAVLAPEEYEGFMFTDGYNDSSDKEMKE